ncbi:hypothetical protein UFOVP833_58 [uncultured Caudovirales phage]|uniref:Uncharacterized protein n=1 Tax=uncultured Caudovirales phage TaxID=2100421 RepID=A0A6J5STK9_9CAUD|nr:hypothetical protein UFOVP833_58 [uncultured Caudovirales phage]CAB4218396.1 hypothetical protein UFOVP1603_30 [uncultured Caudovirales phage]
MTALSMVQTACAWLALPVPLTVFSSTEAQTIQMRNLLNEELTELRTWPDMWWRKLLRQHTFVSEAADVQTLSPLPNDLGYIIANTMWDRTMSRPVVGPISPETWQAWKARPILTSVLYGFRLRGNDFLTAPNPPAGDTVAYEYISNLAVYASGDTVPTKQYFTADTDTAIFDETLMERGLRWRFLKAKGLPCEADYDVWINMLQRLGARDKAMPTLSTAGPLWPNLAGPYIPAFNFPS